MVRNQGLVCLVDEVGPEGEREGTRRSGEEGYGSIYGGGGCEG